MLGQFRITGRWLTAGLLMLLTFTPSLAVAEEKEDPILALVKKRVKAPGKPFTLVIGVKVKEGMAAKFEEAFAKALTATRKEKGCLTYDLNHDTEDAQRYLVYERWKSVADLEAHLQTAHIKALLKTLPDLATGPPEPHVLVPASE